MSVNYRKISHCLERSVRHIFSSLFDDPTADEIFDVNTIPAGHTVLIEMDGTLKGLLRIRIPQKTISAIAKKMDPNAKGKKAKEREEDIAGEMGNLIAGTLTNQLQFIGHSIRLFPPEFGEDLIGLTTFYENVSMIFNTAYGYLGIDLFYREKED